MDRAFASGASGSAPSAPASPSIGYPTAGNPGAGTPATKPGPYWYHMITEELLEIITAAGITPAQGTLTQLASAIQSGKLFSSAAGGTADALTASFVPAVATLINGMSLYVRAGSANATTTPTFTPNSGTIAAKTIVKGAGAALAAGDIAGGGHWIEVQYDLTLDKWVLLNPATGVSAPSQQPGEVCYFARSTAPTGFLKANGAAVSRTTYASLFAAIGTTFGVGDGSTTFNLPDLRGVFPRGFDDGAGIDSGRVFGSSQLDAAQGHTHSLAINNTAGPAGQNVTVASQSLGNFAAWGTATTGQKPIGIVSDGTNGTPRVATETRPRNIALLACIKY